MPERMSCLIATVMTNVTIKSMLLRYLCMNWVLWTMKTIAVVGYQ